MGSAKRKALAGVTLLTAIVWEAIKTGELELTGSSGAVKLAEIGKLLESGKASLGIYVERSGDQVYFAATLLQPSSSCPFSATLLEARGPIVSSAEELASLLAPSNLH